MPLNNLRLDHRLDVHLLPILWRFGQQRIQVHRVI